MVFLAPCHLKVPRHRRVVVLDIMLLGPRCDRGSALAAVLSGVLLRMQDVDKALRLAVDLVLDPHQLARAVNLHLLDDVPWGAGEVGAGTALIPPSALVAA